MTNYKLRAAAFLLFILLMSGCTKTGSQQGQGSPAKPLSGSKANIVCTIFPQYDWVRQILGEKANDINLTILLNSRVDMHSYNPSVSDIAKIATSDLLIYVGGESDSWVEDALRQAANPNMIVIKLSDLLGEGLKTEEIIEGMEDNIEDHLEENHGDHDDHSDHHEDFDEHVWLSLKNAIAFCTFIADSLSEMNPGNAGVYRANLADYIESLSALDAEYSAAANAASVRTVLFGDRFPFRYLLDDYDLGYYAAFPGCSAETEASFHTIVFLAGKMDELNLKNIMVTESGDESIARTIIRNTKAGNQRILKMDSMQSTISTGTESGITYLSIMESNLKVLKEALN